MLTTTLLDLFRRDLGRLRQEVASFVDEADLWEERTGITNTAGNLTLHLMGNLRHFIGHVIGKSNYTRQRDLEFETRYMPRTELLELIDACEEELTQAFQHLSDEDWSKNYPIEVFGQPMTYAYFLQHLYGHFQYHLGQINYYRRLGKK